MSEAFAVLLGAIVIGTIVLVIRPLRRREAGAGEDDAGETANLIAAREAALQTIRDLDFDYRLGNLTEADYRDLRERHKHQAIALLREVDARSRSLVDPVDLEIERAIRLDRERRRAAPAAAGSGSREPVLARNGSPDVEVLGSRTGDVNGPEAVPAGAVCPSCGRPAREGDRFCSGCGAAVGTAKAVETGGASPQSEGPEPRRTGLGAREAPEAGASDPVAGDHALTPPLSHGERGQAASLPLRSPTPPAARPTPSPRRWLATGGVLSLLVVAGVVWLVASARSAQQDQQPVAQLPPSVGARALAAAPAAGSAGLTAFAAGAGGVYASTDGGRSWQSAAWPGEALALALPPGQPRPVLVAGRDGLSRSDDAGKTWQPVRGDLPGGDVQAVTVDATDPAILYAGVAGKGLYRSNDGGQTWQGLGDNAPRSVAGLASGSGYLYAATPDRGVLASADGQAWSNASGLLNGALPTLRTTALAADPRSGDSYRSPIGEVLTGALYVGTDRGLFKSTDGGVSWTGLPLRMAVKAVAVAVSTPTVLAIDSQDRVFRSDDRGLTWRAKS